MSNRRQKGAAAPARGPADGRRPWQPVTLTPQGRVSDIVQGGGGKLSLVGGDPGEGRKQVGNE